MSARDEVLKILEENRGLNISGEEIGRSLGITRAGVWKIMKSLKEEGYDITSVSNKGYCINKNSDILSSQGIKPWLKFKEIDIYTYKTIDSTNNEAKKIAVNGGAHGTLIVSEAQTQGRGRRGRDFFSPEATGIYMSLILRPKTQIEEAVLITAGASVAVARATKKVTGKETEIKWVNDLYYNKKKIVGILTEAVTDFETGMVECIILGIGINFRRTKEKLPEELEKKVGFLFDEKPKDLIRNALIGEVVNEVMVVFEDLKKRGFLDEYKKRSMVLGKKIRIDKNNQWIEAKAIDINDEGGLIVESKGGKIEVLNSGEISILIS